MRYVLAGLLILVPVLMGATADKPNILFILADDLGYGDLGCYGQKEIQTPHLDRLAKQGMRFTDCYAGSTVCAPSRCCLMTGMHTGHSRIRDNSFTPLAPEDVTVAEVLKKAGYTTGVIGKWGVGRAGSTGIPTRQGFENFFGYLNQVYAHNYYPPFLWRNEQKISLEGNQGGKKTQYSHDLFTREALTFIEKNKGGPFFLYLAYTIPHANNELGRVTKNGMEVPDYGLYADRDWPQPQKGYAAMITWMDRAIGEIMERLKTLGLDDNTVIFFSSDNGPHAEGGVRPTFFKSAGPLRGIKRDLYEGGIRVPMIVRWPGKVKPGVVNDHVCAFWDFLPTAADMAGVAPLRGIDGISMLPTLLSKQQSDHEFLYWEFRRRAKGFHGPRVIQAVRMGQWKAVQKKGESMELYDLESDVGETINVADKHVGIVSRIMEYLKNARTVSK